MSIFSRIKQDLGFAGEYPEGAANRQHSGRRSAASQESVAVESSTEHAPAAAEPKVHLQDPGLPEHDLRQVCHELFKDVGLTWVVYGAGTLEDCFEAFARAAPALRRTRVRPNGLGAFAGQDSVITAAMTGPRGSAIALFCTPEADGGFVVKNVPLTPDKMTGGWHSAIGTLGGSVAASAAQVIDVAHAVPLWELAAFADAKPAQAPRTPIPGLLKKKLTELGWEEGTENLLKGVVRVSDERTQVMFFTSWNANTFALMSPVSQTHDGGLPPILRGKTFGDYRVEVVGDLVMLAKLLPAGPPSPALDHLMHEALELANYSDRVEADLSLEDAF